MPTFITCSQFRECSSGTSGGLDYRAAGFISRGARLAAITDEENKFDVVVQRFAYGSCVHTRAISLRQTSDIWCAQPVGRDTQHERRICSNSGTGWLFVHAAVSDCIGKPHRRSRRSSHTRLQEHHDAEQGGGISERAHGRAQQMLNYCNTG